MSLFGGEKRKERVHREQPPSQAIVRIRLYPQGEGIEDKIGFFDLRLIQSNGNKPILAPSGLVSPRLIDTLERNKKPYVAIGDAIYTRVDGPGSERLMEDKDGKRYIERTYRLDGIGTARYRKQLDQVNGSS